MGKKGYTQTKEHIAKRSKNTSKTMKALWKNPEYRKKQINAFGNRCGKNNSFFGKQHTTETKKKISDKVKKITRQPERKELSRETLKKTWHKHRKYLTTKLSERLKRYWQNPEYRKKMINLTKGKTYEEIYGEEKAKVLKQKRSENFIQRHKENKFPPKNTAIEVKLQKFLRQLGIVFVTNHYIRDINHAYPCDIFIPSKNLVIEADGNHWHNYPNGNEMDHIRTKELLANGFKVLRLWGSDIRIMTITQFNDRLNQFI